MKIGPCNGYARLRCTTASGTIVQERYARVEERGIIVTVMGRFEPSTGQRVQCCPLLAAHDARLGRTWELLDFRFFGEV